jgi:hypothetical protein
VESGSLPFKPSIVHGSGIGSTVNITLDSNLKPLSKKNIILKYADDTNLLVPERKNVYLQAEFEAIQGWAAKTKMILNFTQTK